MFQPQPTPFSAFFPAYLQVPVEDLQRQDDVLREQVNDTSFVATQAGSFSSYHHQAPFPALVGSGAAPTGVVNPCPGPGPGSVAGPGGLGHSGAGPRPGPTGVSQGANAPLSPIHFPLHGAIPHSQLEQPAAAPSLFDHASSSTNLRRASRPPFSSTSRRATPSTKMESNQSLEDDLAAQEAAARTWQPELEGPRVGEKTPIDAITAEYAKADPIYVAKTMALPQTYSHYRPVKGDGNCGWRAIGFCYFELLIQQGSRELVQGEQLRLTQLNDYLVNSGGYDPDMFLDFVESTFQLFKDISDNIHSPDTAVAILTSTFNGDASMGLLYHLRLLAASWLKGNRDQYEAWCETGIDGYCATMIEPPEREIEELGVVLLVEVLLKPAGFILEIAYLDRSAGTEVNTHRFADSTTSIGPYMHLLYRPGHYDILYKPDATEIQVNRMSFEPATFASAPQFSGAFDFNPLAMIPGGGVVGAISSLGQLGAPSMDYSSSPQSPWFPSPHADSSPTPPTQPMPGPSIYATTQQGPLPAQSTPPGPSSIAATPTHEIRFSRYQYAEAMDANAWPEPTFHTNMFRNSHFNKAHYNNPDFTPEEYKPGADDDIEPRLERPSRKKGHTKGGRHSSDDGAIVKKEK